MTALLNRNVKWAERCEELEAFIEHIDGFEGIWKQQGFVMRVGEQCGDEVWKGLKVGDCRGVEVSRSDSEAVGHAKLKIEDLVTVTFL